jgi:hypothetical protein
MVANPWPAVVLGLCAEIVAFCNLWVCGRELLVLVVLGLLSAGIAVNIRPHSVIILGLATASAVLARAGVSPAWDSLRLLIGALGIVAGASALLLLLPRGLRDAGQLMERG